MFDAWKKFQTYSQMVVKNGDYYLKQISLNKCHSGKTSTYLEPYFADPSACEKSHGENPEFLSLALQGQDVQLSFVGFLRGEVFKGG